MGKASRNLGQHLLILTFGVLVIQFFLAYPTFTRPFYQGSFSWLHLVLRLGVPTLLMMFFLPFGWRDLGLTWPTMPARRWVQLLGLLAVVTLVVGAVKFVPGYVDHYSHMRRGDPWEAMGRFGIFTMSTLIPWEILHRGFLLFGLAYLVRDIKEVRVALPVAMVAIFEVAFHFTKPYPEAMGLLIASPLWSLMALRTGSILIPLLIHLWIEVVFVAVVTF